MSDFNHFIYLDSKIIGTARQIAVFFKRGIFQKENTQVLIKKYKHKSAKQLSNIFKQEHIPFRFVNMNDLDNLSSGVVFYPFNAQSNTRSVANRRLKHIFVTHGESNKIASIKPIIRIYDYVTTAGQAGIDRFLAHQIFTQHDIDLGRLIMMGDTFIGETGLLCHGQGIPCIFYAPTWEGGVQHENYSSLSHVEIMSKTIINLCEKYGVHHVVLKPHPNTGHRLPIYKQYLWRLAYDLSSQNLNVTIHKNFSISKWKSWKLRKKNIDISDTLNNFYAMEGLCDISAIETQLLNEDIPYSIFWDKALHKNILANQESYSPSPLNTNLNGTYFWEINSQFKTVEEFKHYIIDAEMAKAPITEKIGLLLNKIKS